MTADLLTTAEVAAHFRCSKWKVLKEANRLRVGMDLGGRSGFRFSEADVAAIKKALAPAPAVPQRRRRRRS